MIPPCKKTSSVSLVALASLASFAAADVGTAATYKTPFTPTACYGNDPTQFDGSNIFAAAGERIWDNGAACGQKYNVRCVSADIPACHTGKVITVKIVDRAQTSVSRPSHADADLVLSTVAYASISTGKTTYVRIEYLLA